MRILNFLTLAILLSFGTASLAGEKKPVRSSKPMVSMEENGGITLPAGFQATILADELGRARHLAVNTNGDVYVKLDKLNEGRGILRLRDANGDGKAEDISGFGNYKGTGIAIKNGYLYASSNEQIFRYALDKTGVADSGNPELIATGLWDRGAHSSKSITLDNAGNIYVNIGAPSNVCQVKDFTKGSPGINPCPLLDSSGGIWQFRVDVKGQSYNNGKRYATGLRNVVGLDWNAQVNDLFVMQHGRDMFFQHYPEMYSQQDGALNPSEEFFRIKPGSDCGWPYCYYDMNKKQKLMNPEYGGDRNKVGDCAGKTQSILQFPGHMAPDGLLFYTGTQFPEKYRNGAFIAFHGSWNRSPEPQEGYFVVYVPIKDGLPSGDWEVFANGFAQDQKDPRKARFRPCGLAQGPDGSLYISDDQKGRIWKVTYGK
jgi:glucose/arabinose dehydrogenase